MKITPIPHGLDLLKSDIERSPGLHMSAIYNDLFQDLEPKRFTRGGTPDPVRMAAGFCLEEMLEEGLKRRHAERPGEFLTSEGIAYSPDLIIFNGSMRLGEIKLTWMSSKEVPRCAANTFPPKFDKWLTQMKAYCHHLETNHARLLAFFVNGDYRFGKGSGPEMLAWDLEFSARELRDNWSMLLNHAKSKGML